MDKRTNTVLPTINSHLNTTKLMRLLSAFAVVLMVGSATAAQLATNSVKKLTLKSAVLGEKRTVLVRTPPGYEWNKVAYPVLYMTDGDAQMEHTVSTIQFLTRNGRIPDLIVVGIVNTDRTRDLTPAKSTDKNAAGELRFPSSGGANNFLKFFETELIPEIEKQYRVQPYRILAGHSFGGLFAIHTMLTKPGLFNSYVAVSPSLDWENAEAFKRAEDFFKNQRELRAILYLSLGNEPGAIGEIFDSLKQVLLTTNIKGFQWKAERMDDEDHESVVLRSYYFGLRKVYEGWQPLRDRKSGMIFGGLKGVDAHYKKLSEKYGYSIPVPEALISQMGFQFLFDGRVDEAIAVFKANVERYPESANVYDSLAKAYEQAGQLDLAEPLYDKARVLGQQNRDPNAATYKVNHERARAKIRALQANEKR